jgi:carboxymethylenebutenolidase
MGGYLARPDIEGAKPGVLVGMELYGVTAHVRDVCDNLARLGYVALAPDLYHRSVAGVELPADEAGRNAGFGFLHQLTREQVLADLTVAYDALEQRSSRIAGMVGLSVGGHLAYLAATQLPLKATVVVYGGWIPTTDLPLGQPDPTITLTGGIRGKVLFLVGDDDPLVPTEQRDTLTAAMTTAGVDHEFVVYPNVGHGFLCDRRPSYDRHAATDAWVHIADTLRLAGGDET